MPSRRTLLAGLGVGVAGLASPATARPVTDSSRPSELGVTRVIDTVAAVSDRVAGNLDFAAVEALREADLEALDRRTAADLDRRLAPVLGRGPSRVAGLRSLAGDLDAGAAASRLGPGVSADGTRLLADLALSADGPAPPARDAFDADAVTAVAVTEDELGAVESFALGVDVDGVFRARVSGDGVTVAEARRTLRAVGVPSTALDDLSASAGDDGVELTGSFAATDGQQPFIVALLLVLLAAVVGTFVLGLGDSVEQRAPQATFSFRYRDGSLTIVHRGGDAISADDLAVDYTSGGQRRFEGWTDRDGDGRIRAGDSYTTRVEPDSGTRVRVVWEGPDGTVTLGLSEAP